MDDMNDEIKRNNTLIDLKESMMRVGGKGNIEDSMIISPKL